MFCSLITDFTTIEAEFDECLREIVSERLKKQKFNSNLYTLLYCRALARCSAPTAPIVFLSKLSVVSAYVKERVSD